MDTMHRKVRRPAVINVTEKVTEKSSLLLLLDGVRYR